jgi:hypothetical protein
MRSFGVTSIGSPERRLIPGVSRGLPSAWHETLAAVAVPLVALAALAFVLIVLPWIISI